MRTNRRESPLPANTPLQMLLIQPDAGEAHQFRTCLDESPVTAELEREPSLAEGLDTLRTTEPDVVVTTLGASGREETSTIRSLDETDTSCPLVVLVDAEHGVPEEALRAGADDYIPRDELSPHLLAKTLWWVQDRARMSTKLRAHEKRLRSINENISEGLYRSVTNEGLVYVNQAFVDMFGYSDPNALLEVDPADLYVNPDVRARLREILHSEGQFQNEEVQFRRRDGTTFTGLLSGTAVRHDITGVEAFDGAIVDISDQKEKEQEQRVLSAALEQVRESIVVANARPIDEGGPQLVYANTAFEEVTGYDVSEARGATPQLIMGPETEEAVVNSFIESLRAGTPWQGEMTNHRKDGSAFVAQWSVAPVTDSEGELSHWVSLQRDVTEERRQEEALRRHRNLLEQTQRLAGAWEADLRDDTVSWSEEVYRIHELPRETDVTIDEAISYYTPDAQSALRQAFRQCIEEGISYDLELPLVTAKGTRRWVRTIGTPVEEVEGEIVSVAGAVQDITERKKNQKALQEREQKAEVLYETTEQLLACSAPEELAGEIEEAVRAAFDYPFIAIHFLRDDRLVPAAVSPEVSDRMSNVPAPSLDEDSLGARVCESGESIIADDLEAFDTDLDYGDLRSGACVPLGDWGAISIASTEPEAVEPFDVRLLEILAAYASAVLSRIEHEDDLRDAKVEAERMNRLKSAFLANISHEIRTPLTSILGFAEAIGEEVGETSSEQQVDLDALAEFSGLIQRSGHRLMETLNAVLNYSKLEAEEMSLAEEDVDLATEAREAAEEFAPQAADRGVEIKVEADGDSIWVTADKGGVRIVLQNLISNAVKYTEVGGSVWVRTGNESGQSYLEIEDTGIGMDPDQTDQLFEAFKQASEGMGREYEGTGLGLAVTKRVVNQMGGTIDVETEKGVGSRFVVRLPRANVEGD